MFRAAAEAETVHAHSHLRAMKGIGSTADNLKEAVAGETYEFESMCPGMVKRAEEAGEKEAARSFRFAMEAERVHARLHQMLLDNLDSGEELTFHLCTVCGNIELGPVDKCSICGAGPRAFKLWNKKTACGGLFIALKTDFFFFRLLLPAPPGKPLRLWRTVAFIKPRKTASQKEPASSRPKAVRTAGAQRMGTRRRERNQNRISGKSQAKGTGGSCPTWARSSPAGKYTAGRRPAGR